MPNFIVLKKNPDNQLLSSADLSQNPEPWSVYAQLNSEQ